MNWKLHELFEDEKAVSPVVGVALLIAMTVILAAVIGAVVLGLGAGSADAPQASFSFEVDADNNLVATHEGGDTLNENEIVLRGDVDADASFTGDTLTAGESFTIDETDFDANTDTVRIVWQDPNSDQTHVLGTYRP